MADPALTDEPHVAASSRVDSADEDPRSSDAPAVPYDEDDGDDDGMNLSAFRRVVQEHQERDLPAPPRALLRYIPEVTDDFIRNFLLRHGMRQTLEMFEVEWYEKKGAAAHRSVPLVPDNYLETAGLLHRVEVLERQLREHAELTDKLNRRWRQARREREFHKMGHHRAVQESQKVSKLLQQTHHNASDMAPTLEELKRRCDGLLKSKTLLVMERDKLVSQVETLERKLALAEQAGSAAAADKPKRSKSSTAKEKGSTTAAAAGSGKAAAALAASSKGRDASPAATRGSPTGADGFQWPPDERQARGAAPPAVPGDPSSWKNTATIPAHSMSITKVAMHPSKPALATCSDDGTWRLLTVPKGELILSGVGHQNWVAAIAMHPRGTMVGTGSGDKTVRLWDLASNACVHTLKAHTDGVLGLDFQETGLLLASSSLDRTSRVWDVEQGVCRQILHGHSAAVNAVQWQQGTNLLYTGSGDKTVAIWDCRMNCRAGALNGHRNAVLSVATVAGGSVLASCDAEGVVALWDVRQMAQRLSLPCGPQAANEISLDALGHWAAVASDDHAIKLINVREETVAELSGHTDAVLGVAFDPATQSMLVSCGADRTVRCWS